MSGLILLCVSAAPLCKKPLPTVGSKPLACKHLSWGTNAELSREDLAVHAHIFESFHLSYICNQDVTTKLPFSERTVLMPLSCLAIRCLLMSGCLQLPKMWPCESAPLHSGQRVSLAIGCPGMYDIRLLKAMFLFQIWPVLYLKMFLLCDSGIDGMVHSASLCGLTLNGCSLSHS